MGCFSQTIFLIAAATAVASAAPAPGSELTIADLRWPEGTDTATVRSSTRVLDGVRGKRIGTIAGGAVVTWKKLVASHGEDCRAWVALEPRGWVCATSLSPGSKPPPPPKTPAPVIVGPLVSAPPARDKFAAIKPGGADAFATVDDLKAGTSKRVEHRTNVSIRANAMWQKINGKQYVFTDQGWIATTDMWWLEPSPFTGIELVANAPLGQIGWVVARRPGAKIAVRATPDPKGVTMRELMPRDRVTVVEDKDGWSRIGVDEWVDGGELRRLAKRTRPDGVGPAERWLDVDLNHQTLIAYEGDQPVFTTLVSTGKIKWDTPHGVFRITGKDDRARMRDSRDPDDSWDVADVPWSIRYMKNFALHGTYWHDGFGRRRSHGCVNLSTTDAKRIYDWVNPDSPAGWTNAENVDGTGTVIRISSAKNPDPKWYDYEGRPLKAIATK